MDVEPVLTSESVEIKIRNLLRAEVYDGKSAVTDKLSRLTAALKGFVYSARRTVIK